MYVMVDFRFFLPEILQESSWLSSCILLIQGYLLARGIVAVYQDCTRARHSPRVPAPVPPEAEPRAEQEPQPAPSPRVVPPVPPPEADPPAPQPAPEEVPEAPPAVPFPVRIHHHHTTEVHPVEIFRTTEGQSYHLFRDCQHIRSMSNIKTNQLCSRCQQKHQRMQQQRG